MRHGSLFSGIGGFDLAAEWMGWNNVFHCEWNPFGQKILKHYWPNAKSYENICTVDFSIHRGEIDILTGGFPCQPYSSAGKRLGKEDERHLWPEMLRAIREIEPTYIVGENVRGLLNWNGGMVFEEVCAELESIGYQVAPVLIPACGKDAPHRRERIWFIAYSESHGWAKRGERFRREWAECEQENRDKIRSEPPTISQSEIASHSDSNGLNKCNGNNEINTSQGRKYAFGNIKQNVRHGDVAYANLQRQEWEWEQGGFDKQRQRGEKRFKQFYYNEHQWEKFPTQSPICSGDDGISSTLDGITFSKWREESIKGYGNAIVPQVAFEIFKAIEKTF